MTALSSPKKSSPTSPKPPSSPSKAIPLSPSKKASSPSVPSVPTGKLVYTGSIAWDWIGRRNAKGAPGKEENVKLEAASPKIYGPANYIDVAQVFTSSSSCHNVLIDGTGVAFTFGRNDHGQLGDGKDECRSDPFPISGLDGKVVHAATGKSHTLFVTETGSVYGCGENKYWAATGVSSLSNVNTVTRISGLKGIKVTSVSCGGEFSLALSDDGKIYAWGNPQYGQLGDGSDHQYIGNNNRIIFDPQAVKPVKGLDDKKIIQIACGSNHSYALDDEGNVYAWGFAGYGRLGDNNSSKDSFVPVLVSGFGDRKNPAKKIAAGPACGMAIDSRDALHVWGKWKNSGDGGQGTPWMYPKHFTGLSGWVIREISCGFAALFALASTSEDVSTISWGQACNHGELGHGDTKPRSATNAVKVESLDEAKVVNISCGAGQTLLIVDPNDPKYKALKTIGELVTTAPAHATEPATKKRKTVAGKAPKSAAAKKIAA